MFSGTLPIKYCNCDCAYKTVVFNSQIYVYYNVYKTVAFDSQIYVYYNDINLLIKFYF